MKTNTMILIWVAIITTNSLAFSTEVIQLAGKITPNPFNPTDYQVVIADNPSVEVAAAASDLSGFLEQVTGIQFPVVTASLALPEHQIIVGPSKALDKLGLSIDWKSLEPEGFIIRTVGQKIVIVGGKRRGTANGVYTFLEEIVGCRWYTPDVSVIPQKPTLLIEPLNIQRVPVFEARSLQGGSVTYATWAARQRLNLYTRFVKYVGGLRPDGKLLQWGSFINNPSLSGAYHYARVHAHNLILGGMLPNEEFDRHPEYFALVDGQRLRGGQLCLTNPDLLKFIVNQAKDWIKSDPTADIISISQGDFYTFCQCPECSKAYRTYGKSGVFLRFVNQVAEEIEKEYPHILVDTLAYQWTDKPPKNLNIRHNVVIRYCPIDACLHHAFDECQVNKHYEICSKMHEWIKIAPRVWLWYYALSYNDLYPFANFKALSRNFQLMRDAGVKGLFIEGKCMIMSGGLADLQTYLFAKLTWNPDYDVDKGIVEFAHACYGAAAEHIISYVQKVNDRDTYIDDPKYAYYRSHTGFHLRYGKRVPIPKAKLQEMDQLFDDAEQAVADDHDSLERVKLVRLSLQYAIMLNTDAHDPIYVKAVRDFFPVARKARIKLLVNHKTGQREDLDTFRQNF